VHQRRADAGPLELGQNRDRPQGEHRTPVEPRTTEDHVPDDSALPLGDERERRDEFGGRT
jgi:hypothetical protein